MSPFNQRYPYRGHGGFGKGTTPSPGVLGCGLSHVQIWHEIAWRPGTSDSDIFLVLEDDSLPSRARAQRWVRALPALRSDPSWGLIYLGCHGGIRGLYGDPGIYGDTVGSRLEETKKGEERAIAGEEDPSHHRPLTAAQSLSRRHRRHLRPYITTAVIRWRNLCLCDQADHGPSVSCAHEEARDDAGCGLVYDQRDAGGGNK